MQICLLLLFLIGALVTCQGRRGHSNKKSSSSSSSSTKQHHHSSSDSLAQIHQERINVDGEWNTFYFGPIGTFAYTSFYYTSYVQTLIVFTDCFCAGDDFQIYVDGVFYAGSYLPSSANIAASPQACEDFELDPAVCYANNPPYASLPWELAPPIDPGFHNITIFVVSSPYNFGLGYLAVGELEAK